MNHHHKWISAGFNCSNMFLVFELVQAVRTCPGCRTYPGCSHMVAHSHALILIFEARAQIRNIYD